MHFVFADNFLASSLLTILMPIVLLISIVVWYLYAVKRVPGKDPERVPPGAAHRAEGQRPAGEGHAAERPLQP